MMYSLNGLIPARFLSLLAHLTVCITLLWESRQSVMSCLPEGYKTEVFNSYQIELVIGLSFAIGMIAFELLTFVTGLTMFNTTSALLSIICHSSACVTLTYFIIDKWQCEWFWWVFTFCSVLPTIADLCVLIDVFVNRKW